MAGEGGARSAKDTETRKSTGLVAFLHRWSAECDFDLRNLMVGAALWPSSKAAPTRWWSFYLYLGPVTLTVEYQRVS